MVGQIQMFNYAYMREGRRRPDPLPRLIATHRHALAEARKQTNAPVILIVSVIPFVAAAIQQSCATKFCGSLQRRFFSYRGHVIRSVRWIFSERSALR